MKTFLALMILLSGISAFAAQVECGAADDYNIENATSSARDQLNSKIRRYEAGKKDEGQSSQKATISNLVVTQTAYNGEVSISICVILN